MTVSLSAHAQGDTAIVSQPLKAATVSRPLIGYLSYGTALRNMPGYALQEQKLADLKAQYDAELKRVEEEFNRKYEEFLDGQKDFPKTILYKRQTELKELMERNVQFKANSRRELAEAETASLATLKQQLNGALATIARERHLIVILNTDGDAVPFLDPTLSEDVTEIVKQYLNGQ